MSIDMKPWQPFPHPSKQFDYTVAALLQVWPELHGSDLVPWPESAPESAGDANAEQAASCIAAWQHFHAGRFEQACSEAANADVHGFAPRCKAMIVYADHLEDDESCQQQLYQQASEFAAAACAAFPDLPAAHYYHAYALGRYGQSISVVKALRQGLGSKVAASLDSALALAPDYPDAHLALGLYHTEIIDKVGKMVARMSYGSTPDKAMSHLDRALALDPRPPVTQVEYGNGIYMLFGDERLDQANDCYRRAAATTPLDAMEKLDQVFAASEMASQ